MLAEIGRRGSPWSTLTRIDGLSFFAKGRQEPCFGFAKFVEDNVTANSRLREFRRSDLHLCC